jgi:CxxC motif-containing protein
MTAPKRILTAVVEVAGGESMLPVKTKEAIAKAKIWLAMQETKAITVSGPVTVGQVIKDNVAGSGVPLVATGMIPGDA